MVNFKCSKKEMDLIVKIVKRAKMKKQDHTRMIMDLCATISNGCPLDLNKLLNAPDLDFNHDIYGIRAHIDRTTGKLQNFFSPRCEIYGSIKETDIDQNH